MKRSFLSIIEALCRADNRILVSWAQSAKGNIFIPLLTITLLAGAIYGFTIGVWRSPLQGFFVAFKFPLLILLTTLGNGIINTMLAQLLGLNISIRQSFLSIMMSFAVLTIILASFSPVILFLVYNLAPMGSSDQSSSHSLFLLTNVALIGFAGVVANINLYGLLKCFSKSVVQSRQILLTWLGVNMFLGCQLSWNMRPFFGTPHLPVTFFRDDPFANSFYEAIWKMVIN